MLKTPWIAAALAAATAATSAGQSQTPADSIAWSAKRALVWSDYGGRPEVTSPAAAMTVYRLSYEDQCALDRYSFSVTSLFQPAQSWVKTSAITSADSGRGLLIHEQGHFDLSEVGARKLRRALSQLQHPCGMTSVERNAIVERHIREDRAAQSRYDTVTQYGIHQAQQVRLVIEIGRELAALAEFAAR